MNRRLKALETSGLLFLLASLTACGSVQPAANADAADARDSGPTGIDASKPDNRSDVATDTAPQGPDSRPDVTVTDTGATGSDTRADIADTATTSADTRAEVADTGTAAVDSSTTDVPANATDTGSSVADTGSDVTDTRPDVTDARCVQAPVVLGSAGAFAVLAGSTVTNTGLTTVTGDLGVSPGTAVTGFGPGLLVGTQHAGDQTAGLAESDLTTAYNDAAGRTLCSTLVAGNLGGLTLTPGLYTSTTSLEISSGDLTLNAQGDANAVFIFQMASTLTTSAGRQVILSGNAKAANVFWQVGSSATLGTTTAFQGTIMASQSIALNSGTTLAGRALARTAAVTMDTNLVIRPAP